MHFDKVYHCSPKYVTLLISNIKLCETHENGSRGLRDFSQIDIREQVGEQWQADTQVSHTQV